MGSPPVWPHCRSQRPCKHSRLCLLPVFPDLLCPPCGVSLFFVISGFEFYPPFRWWHRIFSTPPPPTQPALCWKFCHPLAPLSRQLGGTLHLHSVVIITFFPVDSLSAVPLSVSLMLLTARPLLPLGPDPTVMLVTIPYIDQGQRWHHIWCGCPHLEKAFMGRTKRCHTQSGSIDPSQWMVWGGSPLYCNKKFSTCRTYTSNQNWDTHKTGRRWRWWRRSSGGWNNSTAWPKPIYCM